MVEEVAGLRFPPRADRRLSLLMDRNNEGRLTDEERDEMEMLVALRESIGMVRAKALHLLGLQPE
jgi:hypothetical protein